MSSKQNLQKQYTRTDLACEARVSDGNWHEQILYTLKGGEEIRILRGTDGEGRRFITFFCGRIPLLGEATLSAFASLLSRELRDMAEAVLGRTLDRNTRIMVAGLGNADMTADALGPGTVRRLTVTRHLRAHDEPLYHALGCCELSAVTPGVLGQTGIESGELIKGAVAHVNPHLLIAVDALAARSCDRLAATVQLSDGGLSPGAGVGNFRLAMDKATLGCPVISVGIPTVVDSSTLVYDALEQAGLGEKIPEELTKLLETGRSFIVSPKDSDVVTELSCRLLAKAIDLAFGVTEL